MIKHGYERLGFQELTDHQAKNLWKFWNYNFDHSQKVSKKELSQIFPCPPYTASTVCHLLSLKVNKFTHSIQFLEAVTIHKVKWKWEKSSLLCWLINKHYIIQTWSVNETLYIFKSNENYSKSRLFIPGWGAPVQNSHKKGSNINKQQFVSARINAFLYVNLQCE